MPMVPFFIYFSFCSFLLPTSALRTHFIRQFCRIFEHYYCHPLFRPAISRSDPFVGNYCIFNLDLDNGTMTVIFCSWAICCFEGVHVTHTLYPAVANYSHTDQFREILRQRWCLCTISSTWSLNFCSLKLFHKLCSPSLSTETLVY